MYNYMKNILKLTILSLLSVFAMGCNDDDNTYVDPGLEVTANNISGTWYLAEVNGQPLTEGSYVYIEFVRKDATYKMYQNIGSFQAQLFTGQFHIDKDPYLGSVIRGNYDFEGGDWANRYSVIDLFEDSMKWITVDNDSEVNTYKRCAEIPQDIIDQASSPTIE